MDKEEEEEEETQTVSFEIRQVHIWFLFFVLVVSSEAKNIKDFQFMRI